MIVLSLCDGMACGMQALKEAGHSQIKYMASEIDQDAIKIARKNHPNIIQVGDMRNLFYRDDKLWVKEFDWTQWDKLLHKEKDPKKLEAIYAEIEKAFIFAPGHIRYYGPISVLIGGTPCQSVSLAGKGEGLYGNTPSALFWQFARLKKEINPIFFFLENVKMSKKNQDAISLEMGVEPYMVNSKIVSGQNRERLYWTNIPFPNTLLTDKKISLSSVLESQVDEKYFLPEQKILNYIENGQLKLSDIGEKIVGCAQRGRYVGQNKTMQMIEMRGDDKSNALTTVKKDSMVFVGGFLEKLRLNDGKHFSRNFREGGRVYWTEAKAPALTAQSKGHMGKHSGVYTDGFFIRNLTPTEGERLQTLPDGYTEGVSETKRWNLIGNGWTVAVIKEFFKML